MKKECGIKYNEAVITGERRLAEDEVYKNFGQNVSVGKISATAAIKLDCSACSFSETLERTAVGTSPSLQAIELAETEAKEITEVIRGGCKP